MTRRKKEITWPQTVWIVASVDYLSNEWFISRRGARKYADRKEAELQQKFTVRAYRMPQRPPHAKTGDGKR